MTQTESVNKIFLFPRAQENPTVGGVVDGGDDAGSQDNLLPGLANVDDIDAVGPGLPQVRLHVHLHVLAAEMGLGGEEHLNVLGRGVEHGGEVGGCHRDCIWRL